MKSFTDLIAWQQGMKLVTEVYRLVDTLPKSEEYGLKSQLRKASVSVLANLAEGYSRSTNADKAHKYTIARGECAEVHALLLICIELKKISSKEAEEAIKLVLEVGPLLTGLVKKFSPSPSPTPSPSRVL